MSFDALRLSTYSPKHPAYGLSSELFVGILYQSQIHSINLTLLVPAGNYEGTVLQQDHRRNAQTLRLKEGIPTINQAGLLGAGSPTPRNVGMLQLGNILD